MCWLKSDRDEADHLADLNLLVTADTQIWQRGRVENVVICRLYDRALVFGAPPRVVHVAVGNCSNGRLFNILASDWKEVEQALVSGSRLISFLPEKTEIFA